MAATKPKITKGVYSISELKEMGYPERILNKLLHDENFSRFGFRTSNAPNSKAYMHKEKLDRYIEHQMDDQNGVLTRR